MLENIVRTKSSFATEYKLKYPSDNIPSTTTISKYITFGRPEVRGVKMRKKTGNNKQKIHIGDTFGCLQATRIVGFKKRRGADYECRCRCCGCRNIELATANIMAYHQRKKTLN